MTLPLSGPAEVIAEPVRRHAQLVLISRGTRGRAAQVPRSVPPDRWGRKGALLGMRVREEGELRGKVVRPMRTSALSEISKMSHDIGLVLRCATPDRMRRIGELRSGIEEWTTVEAGGGHSVRYQSDCATDGGL